MSDNGGPIRVVIVDDHPLMREGIRKVLDRADDIEVIAEAASGEQAVRVVNDNNVDVILLDYRLPDRDGVEVLHDLRRCTQAKVVVVSFFDDLAHIEAVLRNGAAGYVTKRSAPEELIDAVRGAHRGYNALSPDAATRLVRSLHRTPDSGASSLTPREREVWRLLGRGMSNAEIAETLSITPRTTKFHVGNLLRKIQAKSRTEAASMAHRLGVADTPAPPADL